MCGDGRADELGSEPIAIAVGDGLDRACGPSGCAAATEATEAGAGSGALIFGPSPSMDDRRRLGRAGRKGRSLGAEWE